MKVLIACEFSGTVREAFKQKGHDAWSCDLLPSEIPGQHIQGDVISVLKDGWDLMIAHPPCTYLAVSGMHWTARGYRDYKLTEDALEFVTTLMNAPIDKIAIENPVSVISSKIRKPDQIVQPWWFGDNASKKTCLWLKNLPTLNVELEKVIPPDGWEIANSIGDSSYKYKNIDGVMFRTKTAQRTLWGNQTPSGQNKLGPSADRWKIRSRTFKGIADAMSEQWGQTITSIKEHV